MDRQQDHTDDVHDGRLSGGEVAVRHDTVQEFARALRVNAVGEVPVPVVLPQGEQYELDGQGPGERRRDDQAGAVLPLTPSQGGDRHGREEYRETRTVASLDSPIS